MRVQRQRHWLICPSLSLHNVLYPLEISLRFCSSTKEEEEEAVAEDDDDAVDALGWTWTRLRSGTQRGRPMRVAGEPSGQESSSGPQREKEPERRFGSRRASKEEQVRQNYESADGCEEESWRPRRDAAHSSRVIRCARVGKGNAKPRRIDLELCGVCSSKQVVEKKKNKNKNKKMEQRLQLSLRWFHLRGSEFSYGVAVLISLHDLLFPVPDHNNEGGSIAVSFILCR